MKILGNSYVLGLGIVTMEFVTNFLLKIVIGEKALTGSVLIFTFFAGWIYSAIHNEKMSKRARLETIATYLLVVLAITLASTLSQGLPLGILLIISFVLFLLMGLAMYVMLTFGSKAGFRPKQVSENSIELPSVPSQI